MSWLVYDTYHVIRIENKTLSGLYYILSLLAIIWSIYSIVIGKGYMEYEKPVGSIEVRIRNKGQITTEKNYCSKSMPCKILDESELFTRLGVDTFLFATHIKELKQKRVCPIKDNDGSPLTCDRLWETTSTAEYFVSQVEDIEVRIRHSMKAALFYDESDFDHRYSATQAEMEGVLFSHNQEGKSKITHRFSKGEPYDHFTINELLIASGHADGLDGESEVSESKTVRETGTNVYLDLSYNNVRCGGELSCAFGAVPTTYRYRANFVSNDFSFDEIVDQTEEWRTKRIKKGVYLEISRGGKIGRFSWGVLLINIFSGLGMLNFIVILIDLLATYILPYRSTFGRMKITLFENDKDKKNETQKEKSQ